MKSKWERVAMASPLAPQFNHLLVTIRGGDNDSSKVFALGFDEILSEGFQIYQFDSKMDGWNLLPCSSVDSQTNSVVKTNMYGYSLAGFGSSIYVFGGIPQMPAGHILRFDTLKRVWSLVLTVGAPTFLLPLQAAVTVKDKILILGGNAQSGLLDEVHSFNPMTNTWNIPKVLGTSPPYSQVSATVLLNDERILISGGGSRLKPAMWFLEVNTPFVKSQKETLGGDVVAWSTGHLDRTSLPVIVCGPSGVGKGTLINKLMEDFPDTFGFSISHTTRRPREKEISGVHYHFTNRTAMELEVKQGNFLESADVHGNLYGTSIAAVEAVAEVGKRCILDIDVQGALSVRKSLMDALFIFVAPPSFEELEKRLRGRGTETEEQIQKRLKNARTEIEQSNLPSLFDHILVNGHFETAYEELKTLLGLNLPATQCVVSENSFGSSFVTSLGLPLKRSTVENLGLMDAANLVGGAPGDSWGLRWTPFDCIPESTREYLKPSESRIENIADLNAGQCLVTLSARNRESLRTFVIHKRITGQNGRVHI